MATYAQIAQDTISRKREDGSVKSFRFTFEQRDVGAQDYKIPLEGYPVIYMGDSGDDPQKPIRTHVLEMEFKDKDSALIDIVRNAATREVQVTVEETSSGRTLFEGYVLKDFNTEDLYRPVQGIPVRAIGSLADTQAEAPETVANSWHEFAGRIDTALDLDRELDVYTSLDHDNRAGNNPLPVEMYIEEDAAASVRGGGEGSLRTSLEGMMQALGWKCFQRNGRLVWVDQYDQFVNRAGITKYEGDGSGGYTQTTEDIRLTLNENNVVEGGDIEQQPDVVSLQQRFNMNTRRLPNLETTFAATVSQGNEFTNELSFGLMLAGDEATVSHEGQIHSDGDPPNSVNGEVGHTRIVLEDLREGGGTLHYDFDAEEWKEGSTKYYKWASFSFTANAGAQSISWAIDKLKLPPVPDGVIGNLKIILTNELDISNGSSDDVNGNEQDFARTDSVNVRDEDASVTHVFESLSGDSIGDELTNDYYIGDAEAYSNEQAFRYVDATQGITLTTDTWVSATGNGPLGQVVANRLGTVVLGTGIEFTVRLRDTDNVDLLTVFEIDDNDANTRVCFAKKIEYDLFRGFYDVLLREVFNGYNNQSNYYTQGVAQPGTGTGSGASGGPGDSDGSVPEHGDLPGLGDDDHPQYFNEARGDARYVRPNTTPTLDQVVLNNPASVDNHALRAGQVLNTTAPITGGDKLRNGPNIGLSYNSTNLATPGGVLDTIQDIHPDAAMTLKSLLLKEGLTLDDIAGYIRTQDFNHPGFAGTGFDLQKDSNGNWTLVTDNIVIRNQAKIFEILVQQLRATAQFLLTEGHRIEEVQENNSAWDVIASESDIVASTSDLRWQRNWRMYIPEDTRLLWDDWDMLKRQEFSGRNVGVTEATVVDLEAGSATVTDNTPRRWVDVVIEDGSDIPAEAMSFARLGNRKNSDRQGGILLAGSGADAPYTMMYDNVDRFSKFGSSETIISYRGNLEGKSFPEFSELDGTQGRLYGDVIRNAYVSGTIAVTGGNAATKQYSDDNLQEAKDYTDDKVTSQAGNAIIRQDSGSGGDGPTQRPDGSSLTTGDMWVETNNNDKPYTWNGSAWVEAYTLISGDYISTPSLAAITVNTGALFVEDRITVATGGDIVADSGNWSLTETQLTAVNADITGHIVAETGEIQALDVTGEITIPPPFTASGNGRINSSGIDLIYDGGNSQRITWYGGLGLDVLELWANNNGGQVGSDFDLNIYAGDGNKLNLGTGNFNEVHFNTDAYMDGHLFKMNETPYSGAPSAGFEGLVSIGYGDVPGMLTYGAQTAAVSGTEIVLDRDLGSNANEFYASFVNLTNTSNVTLQTITWKGGDEPPAGTVLYIWANAAIITLGNSGNIVRDSTCNVNSSRIAELVYNGTNWIVKNHASL